MAEFWMAYNPFTVETSLSVKINGEWVPVSEESGLLRVSKMRMQRWLEPASGASYFDELREAAGEDNIDIFFSGTKEDLADLQTAARAYTRAGDGVHIAIKESGNAEKNSSRAKLKQIKELLRRAHALGFRILIPHDVWDWLQRCLNPPSAKAVLMPFAEWAGKEDMIFSDSSWQMICLTFPFEQIRSKEMRKLLRSFAKRLDMVHDRRFDRERFLFICHYADNAPDLESRVKKLLMEYGMQDMNRVILDNEELARLDDDGKDTPVSAALQYARQSIMIFNDRYAEQYRLRKMHDVLQQMCDEQGFVKGPKLFREVDRKLRENPRGANCVTDAGVQNAFDGICSFLDSIGHLLNISADCPAGSVAGGKSV